MILLARVVRDEADILPANLEHHLAAGVDRVAVLDNGSTDGTADVLETYVRAGVAEVVREDPPDFRLADALDRLVRAAAARQTARRGGRDSVAEILVITPCRSVITNMDFRPHSPPGLAQPRDRVQ